MRILITSDWYTEAVNGVVTSVLNLKRGLEELGHEVRILTLSDTIHSYMEDDVYYIGSVSAGILYPGARLRTARSHKMLQDIIEWKPDVVHSNCEFSTFLLAHGIAKKLQIPLIHTYHTVYENYTHYFSPSKKWGKKAVRVFSRLISGNVDCLIAPTQKVESMLRGYGIGVPIEVVPTGIDLDCYHRPLDSSEVSQLKHQLGIEEGDMVLAFIGRLSKEKNCEELLSAMEQMKDLPVTMLFVGDGPHRESLEQMAGKENLGSKVIFAGMAAPEEVWRYYKLGDLFVSASTSETQGLTYIEAMASGLPLLCHKDSCLDHILINDRNGWQYETEQELIEKVKECLQEKDKLRMLQNYAELDSRVFSVRSFAGKMEEVYQEARKRLEYETERMTA